MDARADAALRMALGNSRDDVIAELQARIKQLEQRVATFAELHLETQWDDYMAMAAKILLTPISLQTSPTRRIHSSTCSRFNFPASSAGQAMACART